MKTGRRHNRQSGGTRAKVARILRVLHHHKVKTEGMTGAAIFREFCRVTGRGKS